MTRALESYVKAGVGAHADDETKKVVQKWIFRLTHAKDLWSFHRLCRDAALIFGQMYVTRGLMDCIENMDNETETTGKFKLNMTLNMHKNCIQFLNIE